MTPQPKAPCLDEIDRVAVQLSDSGQPCDDPEYALITFERQANGLIEPQLMRLPSSGLPCLPRWRVFDALCEQRAQRCVDSELRVRGRCVTPERYLSLWRAAMLKALPPSELATQRGLRLLADLVARRSAMHSGTRRGSAPFVSFADFEAHYSAHLRAEPNGFVGLTLDLSQLQALGHARYFEALALESKQAEASLRLRLALEVTEIPLLNAEASSHVLSH
jgi:hypothetical protein